MKNWIYQHKEFLPTYSEILLNHYFGFVYLITNTVSGKQYVGKKNFHSFRKGKKHESDWRIYWGSSLGLTSDIISSGSEQFTREILSLHETPKLVDYHEIREMFLRDVMNEQHLFYNNHIPAISFK